VAQKAPTITVAVLVGAMCATPLVTVGRTEAAQVQIAERLEAAGSRHLRITDVNSIGFMTPSVVATAGGFDSVQVAIGIGSPIDVAPAHLGMGGTKVTAWPLVGDLGGAVDLVQGRWPQAGEAIVSATAQQMLGLDHPVGVVEDRSGSQFAVVGSYAAESPFEQFAEGVIIVDDRVAVRSLDIITTTAATAPPTQVAVLALLARPDPSDLNVESPETLAQIQASVTSDVGNYGRGLLLLVLAGGSALVAVVALADVLLRRKDLGRRRALGATRALLVVLVVARTGLAGLGGALLATGITSAAMSRTGDIPALDFTAGTVILAVLTAAVAAVPPAILAAFQDPVRVLRTA